MDDPGIPIDYNWGSTTLQLMDIMNRYLENITNITNNSG